MVWERGVKEERECDGYSVGGHREMGRERGRGIYVCVCVCVVISLQTKLKLISL